MKSDCGVRNKTNLGRSVDTIFIADQNRRLVALHGNGDLSGSLEQLTNLNEPISVIQRRKPFTIVTERQKKNFIASCSQDTVNTCKNNNKRRKTKTCIYFLFESTACSLYALCLTALKSGSPSPYMNLVWG